MECFYTVTSLCTLAGLDKGGMGGKITFPNVQISTEVVKDACVNNLLFPTVFVFLFSESRSQQDGKTTAAAVLLLHPVI